MKSQEVVCGDADKIQRYGWKIKDARGRHEQIHKDKLMINPIYQRPQSIKKARIIAANFSWVGCGAITVAHRNGEYYVIDGGHRVLGAKLRSDIDTLDCMVFETESLVEEARGFENCNINRWRVAAIATYNAQVAGEKPDALYLKKTLDDLDLKVGSAHAQKGYIGWIVTCYWMIKQSRPKFEQTMKLIKEMGDLNDCAVTENLARGLFYLNNKLTVDVDDPKLRKRILGCTIKEFNNAIRDAVVMTTGGSGGARVYALGILTLLNKGLRTQKFAFKVE
jgi:hypothetical protein